jgi:hypothetical protein
LPRSADTDRVTVVVVHGVMDSMIMGCENTTALMCWKEAHARHGILSVPELIDRPRAIEADRLSHILPPAPSHHPRRHAHSSHLHSHSHTHIVLFLRFDYRAPRRTEPHVARQLHVFTGIIRTRGGFPHNIKLFVASRQLQYKWRAQWWPARSSTWRGMGHSMGLRSRSASGPPVSLWYLTFDEIHAMSHALRSYKWNPNTCEC